MSYLPSWVSLNLLDIFFNFILASNLQCAITGVIAGGQRKKYKVPYPDMGNGRHAAKLRYIKKQFQDFLSDLILIFILKSDKEWEEFNNYQRTHYNYLEHLTPLTANLLIGGLFNPILTTTLGVVYMVGRFFYTRGYIAKGAKGRYRVFD